MPIPNGDGTYHHIKLNFGVKVTTRYRPNQQSTDERPSFINKNKIQYIKEQINSHHESLIKSTEKSRSSYQSKSVIDNPNHSLFKNNGLSRNNV